MLHLVVNGRPVPIHDQPPNRTLLQFLREDLGLTGTKEGCAEGDCGACTVAVREAGGYRATNACLVLLPMMNGKEIVTVEGLSEGGALHPAQSVMVEKLGSQCGYCTPGVVMSLFEACYRLDLDEPWKLDDQMCGNLCRCTGYRPIREAAAVVGGCAPDDRFARRLDEPIAAPESLDHRAGGQRFWAPATLDELFAILRDHPAARIIAGGTDLSLLVTKRFEVLPELVSVENISVLSSMEARADMVSIGAAVRLSDLEAFARRELPSIERMLRYFGSRQIKNRGTVGGNLANASPIGDLPPILLALGATVVLVSERGRRRLPLDVFFLAYRKTALEPGEIVERVEVPRPPPSARVTAYKVSKRQELDISTVSAGLYVNLDGPTVREARFAYGGMAAVPKRAAAVERAVIGKAWTEATVAAACAALERDFTPIDDHRGSAWYRRTVARNLLIGFFHETAGERSPRHRARPTGTVVPGSPS
jgi:xanthine dehydrogenase small subunit